MGGLTHRNPRHSILFTSPSIKVDKFTAFRTKWPPLITLPLDPFSAVRTFLHDFKVKKEILKSKAAGVLPENIDMVHALSYCHRQQDSLRSRECSLNPSTAQVSAAQTRRRIRMRYPSLGNFPNRSTFRFLFLALSALIACATITAQRQAQTEDRPLFAQFRGVSIGTPADEVRKKLSGLRDKSDELDIFMINDNQSVQVYYDKGKTVSAISIDFMSGGSEAPAPKDVIGAEPDKRADGSAYRMVRYPKAGYWVSYSKTAGDSPTITITMQKIEH